MTKRQNNEPCMTTQNKLHLRAKCKSSVKNPAARVLQCTIIIPS